MYVSNIFTFEESLWSDLSELLQILGCYKAKKFEFPKKFPAPLACGAYSKLQDNPFFRVFYLFLNAQYSKHN